MRHSIHLSLASSQSFLLRSSLFSTWLSSYPTLLSCLAWVCSRVISTYPSLHSPGPLSQSPSSSLRLLLCHCVTYNLVRISFCSSCCSQCRRVQQYVRSLHLLVDTAHAHLTVLSLVNHHCSFFRLGSPLSVASFLFKFFFVLIIFLFFFSS